MNIPLLFDVFSQFHLIFYVRLLFDRLLAVGARLTRETKIDICAGGSSSPAWKVSFLWVKGVKGKNGEPLEVMNLGQVWSAADCTPEPTEKSAGRDVP